MSTASTSSAVRHQGEVGSVSVLWFYTECHGGVPVDNRSVRWLSWVLAAAAPAVGTVAPTSPPPVSSRPPCWPLRSGPTQGPRSRPSGLPGAPRSVPMCPYGQRPVRRSRSPSLALIAVGTGNLVPCNNFSPTTNTLSTS
jgi:hypothetical protein